MRRVLVTLMAVCLFIPAGGPRAQPRGAHAIPFRFVLERQIVFPMTINGRPAEAWLDSGAGATVVDARFAKEIGLEIGEPVTAHGVAGEVAGVRMAHADLAAGGLSMPDRRVVVIDLAPVEKLVQRPVQVLLGRDVFDEAIVDIDFPRKTVALLPRDGFVAPKAAPLALKRSGDLRSVPIRIRGVELAAILDLGNSDGLLIDREFAAHYDFFADRPTSTTLGVGAEGARERTLASLDRVELGGVSFDGVPTSATANLTSKAPANVGLQLLSRFHLTIDFAGDRIWMAPDPDARKRPFRKNRAGLALAPGGERLMVVHVGRGSPAERAGWKTGEIIRAVDGRPIPDGFAGLEAGQWVYRPAGTTVALTMADGKTRQLTLADYY